MKRKLLHLAILLFIGLASAHAQVACSDTNKYVNYKNTGSTGAYTLTQGTIEKAAQTYIYSGPGKINSVRIYGNYTTIGTGGVPLRVNIYNVDANGRPTSIIQHADVNWWWFDNFVGHVDVPFSGGGVTVSHNFAVEVELRFSFFGPYGNSFNLRYTGNGEGRGQDLASMAGTQTGGNWSSAKNDFNMDGDYYIVPKMTNFITSQFSIPSQCVAAGVPVAFTNSTQMSTDSQFNTIGLSTYAGSSHFYEWNFGDGSALSNAANPSHTFAAPGVYTVSLKSTLVGWTNTCSDTKTMRVSVGLSVSAGSIVNATCAKTNTGSFVALGAGGTGVYTYSTNGDSYQSSPNFTNLYAGIYTLYVKDDLGCVSQTNVTITEPSRITFAPMGVTNATCGHTDGAILAAATGGTGTIQYQIQSSAFQATGSFLGLAGGSYTITAKDANGCTASAIVSVNDIGGPSLTIVSMTNVSCANGSDGTIELQGTGGAGTLMYSINSGVNFQASGIYHNLSAGTYGVMVKDANGCRQSSEVVLSQPTSVAVTAAPVRVSCHGGTDGQINITSAIGGTGSFTYSINGTVYQSGTLFSGLAAGTYTVHAKDVAGCTATTQVSVTEPALLTASAVATPASCNGSYNGSVVVTAAGGTGDYFYNIEGSESQGTNAFVELPAGVYTIHVTDQNQCVATTTATVTQPAAITATFNTTASTCGNSNGGFLATAAGGSGSGYLYSINDTTFNGTGSFTGLASGNYYVVISDAASCANVISVSIVDANGPSITGTSHTNVSCHSGMDGSITVTGVSGGTGTLEYSSNGVVWQSSPVFSGLGAGSHTITVKDANGCTGTVTLSLSEPNAFTMSTTLTDLTCNNDTSGVATIFASGGAGVFAYTIDNGLTYQSSNVFDGLHAGSYTVFVRDAASCTSSISFSLTEPSKIILSQGVLDVSCHGANNGAISLAASGGTGHFQYSINSVTFQNLGIFSNLPGGSYTVYAKDSSQCLASLTLTVHEPAPLTTLATVNNVSCSGGSNGSVILTVSGGTHPYTYAWSNISFGEDLINVGAGTYIVKVTDANGCVLKDTNTVTQPASPLIVNGVVTNETTSSSADGSVVLTVTGGVSPYSYLWSNQAVSKNISGLVAGNYTVNVTDANGCITSGVFTVTAPLGILNTNGDAIYVQLYPNPTSQIATIEVKGAKISSMKVISMTGALISESAPNESLVQVDASALSAGVYFVQMVIDGNLVTKRMTVNR